MCICFALKLWYVYNAIHKLIIHCIDCSLCVCVKSMSCILQQQKIIRILKLFPSALSVWLISYEYLLGIQNIQNIRNIEYTEHINIIQLHKPYSPINVHCQSINNLLIFLFFFIFELFFNPLLLLKNLSISYRDEKGLEIICPMQIITTGAKQTWEKRTSFCAFWLLTLTL